MAQTYGRWTIIEPLDEGGQSHTFLVHDENDPHKKRFVLKRLKNLRRLRRFENEVRACLELSHKNLLSIEDKDLEGNQPYFVAEYCSRGPLTPNIMSALSLVEKLSMFSSVCRGVAHAHDKNVTHRDLKPENIFLREDLTPVVGDFGLCFITESGERVTLVDEQVGSRFYMAPELAHGLAEEVTPAADVYSLGKILYWMIASKIFDREVYRTPRFDLTADETNPDLFFVYDLFDKTIVEDRFERLPNASKVADQIDNIIGLIKKKAHFLDLNVPQHCTYCGLGSYKVIADSTSIDDRSGSIDVYNFGFNLIRVSQWLILVCSHCGNVQIFRPDHANGDVWRTSKRRSTG